MKKFCICVMMLFIIGIISGCCNTHQTVSDEQSGESSGKELEFSDVVSISNRGLFMRTRILKDNKYGNEYIILESNIGVSICPRIRN